MEERVHHAHGKMTGGWSEVEHVQGSGARTALSKESGSSKRGRAELPRRVKHTPPSL